MARPFNRTDGRVVSNANNRSRNRVLLIWVSTANRGRGQRMNSKVSYAVAAILGGTAYATATTAAAADATTTADTSATSDSLAEITVTATRRSENIQHVP